MITTWHRSPRYLLLLLIAHGVVVNLIHVECVRLRILVELDSSCLQDLMVLGEKQRLWLGAQVIVRETLLVNGLAMDEVPLSLGMRDILSMLTCVLVIYLRHGVIV